MALPKDGQQALAEGGIRQHAFRMGQKLPVNPPDVAVIEGAAHVGAKGLDGHGHEGADGPEGFRGQGGRGQLGEAEVRQAEHADPAVAPFLPGNPHHRVIAVVVFLHGIGAQRAFRKPGAAAFGHHDSVSMVGVAADVGIDALVFQRVLGIGRAHEDDGAGLGGVGQVQVIVHQRAVAQGQLGVFRVSHGISSLGGMFSALD